MQQEQQQHLSPNSMDSGGGKNWTYDSCSLAQIDENESSITSQFSSPTAILVPLDDENDIPLMDDSGKWIIYIKIMLFYQIFLYII